MLLMLHSIFLLLFGLAVLVSILKLDVYFGKSYMGFGVNIYLIINALLSLQC